MNDNTTCFLLHCVPPLFVLFIVSVNLRFGPLYLSRTSAAFNCSTKCGRDTNPVLSPVPGRCKVEGSSRTGSTSLICKSGVAICPPQLYPDGGAGTNANCPPPHFPHLDRCRRAKDAGPCSERACPGPAKGPITSAGLWRAQSSRSVRSLSSPKGLVDLAGVADNGDISRPAGPAIQT